MLSEPTNRKSHYRKKTENLDLLKLNSEFLVWLCSPSICCWEEGPEAKQSANDALSFLFFEVNYKQWLGLTSHTVCDHQIFHSTHFLLLKFLSDLASEPTVSTTSSCGHLSWYQCVQSSCCVSSSFSGPKTRRHSKINAINFYSKPRLPGRVSWTYWSNAFDTFWKRGV